ncbi:MAG: DsbA family oxidoreductase [Bacteroidota bacterium]
MKNESEMKLDPQKTNNMENKLKVEIWSDVMCPFCYIGKRKFEIALNQFEQRDEIEIVWKSFQLSPNMVTQPDKNIHQFLAEHKGISVAEAKNMNNYVTDMAKKVGLTYNFDTAIVANSRKAHQFSHFALQHGKQNEAEELLFKSYFTDGKNTDDLAVLLELGRELGFNTEELQENLASSKYDGAVSVDINEARQIGVSGVPFFVFDRKYAISGAQEVSVFLETIEKSFEEWNKNNPAKLKIQKGTSCDVDGKCE